jgi:hypothetical protein
MSPARRAILHPLVAAAVVASSALATAAEEPPSAAPGDALAFLAPGTPVRLTSSLVAGRVSGRLLQSDARALQLLPQRGGPVRVPLDSLKVLEVSYVQRRHTRKGLAAGLVAGVLIGALAEVDDRRCHDENQVVFCSRGEALAGGLMGGALMGAGIGALVKTDHWQPIAIDRLRVGLAPLRPTAGRGGLTLALRW